MRDKDGGPAFPYSALEPDKETRQLVGSIYADNRGMSLRDYFAGQVLDMASQSLTEPVDVAARAYAIAAAMLAERAKQV